MRIKHKESETDNVLEAKKSGAKISCKWHMTQYKKYILKAIFEAKR